MDFLEEAKNIQKEMSDYRRRLHENAEVGFELPKTVEFVRGRLEEMGCRVNPCGKSGLVTQIGNSGKVFLLRADMDALPIEEETELPFASKNGNMHACGHDMHTAMLLGAARLLKKHEKSLKGTVKLMFQPAEEILSGAKNMMDNGVLENPVPDCAMMIHVMAGLPLEVGKVIVSSGGTTAPAADYFTVSVKGKGCHGSMPSEGVDALTAAARILIGLQEISARELSADEQAVLTVGKMRGGTAGNVIADTVTMEGTLRTYSQEIREYVKKRITEISEGMADTFRGKATADFGNGCPPFENDPTLSSEIKGYLTALLGDERVCDTKTLIKNGVGSGGSEDFAYISQTVPSLMLTLGAGNSEEGFKYPQHHPRVEFDERALPIGCAVLCHCAFSWLENH